MADTEQPMKVQRNEKAQRNEKGQFVKGHNGGPGRPAARRSHSQFREMLLEVVTEEDFRAVAEQLISSAKSGEEWAVKYFLDRLCGRPKQAVDIDTNAQSVGVLVVPGNQEPEDWIAAEEARKGKATAPAITAGSVTNGSSNGHRNGNGSAG